MVGVIGWKNHALASGLKTKNQYMKTTAFCVFEGVNSKPFLESLGLDPAIFDPECEAKSRKDCGSPSGLDLDELVFRAPSWAGAILKSQ